MTAISKKWNGSGVSATLEARSSASVRCNSSDNFIEAEKCISGSTE
jgi:hypothetical protein